MTDIIDTIISLRLDGNTWEEVGKMVGLSASAARGRYRRATALSSTDQVEDVEPSTPDPAIEFNDWRTSFARMIGVQDEYKDRSRYTNKASVSVNKGERVVLVGTSDWHIGLKSVDYKRLTQDITSWIDNDVLVIINGDMIENGVGSQGMGSATEQLISPELQHLIAKDIVNQLRHGNLILVTQGNHEERSGRRLFETMRNIIPNADVPLFGNKGILTLGVDEQTYKLFVGHKMPGATDSNPFGAHLRINKTYNNIDVSLIGHVHTWNYASIYYQGKYTHFATTGTYSVDEEYAVRFYNPVGGNINHYFGFDNEKHAVKHFNTLDEAITWRDTV